jgi:hypothetical protein
MFLAEMRACLSKFKLFQTFKPFKSQKKLNSHTLNLLDQPDSDEVSERFWDLESLSLVAMQPYRSIPDCTDQTGCLNLFVARNKRQAGDSGLGYDQGSLMPTSAAASRSRAGSLISKSMLSAYRKETAKSRNGNGRRILPASDRSIISSRTVNGTRTVSRPCFT